MGLLRACESADAFVFLMCDIIRLSLATSNPSVRFNILSLSLGTYNVHKNTRFSTLTLYIYLCQNDRFSRLVVARVLQSLVDSVRRTVMPLESASSLSL